MPDRLSYLARQESFEARFALRHSFQCRYTFIATVTSYLRNEKSKCVVQHEAPAIQLDTPPSPIGPCAGEQYRFTSKSLAMKG